jgi:gas vesicle protein
MRDYVYAEKTEFVDAMKKDLAAIEADLDRLSAEVEQSRGEARAKAKLELEAARKKWAEAKAQLDAAEAATEDTWEDVKRGFKKSYGELKESIAEARQWLSDEIEP